MNRLPSRPPACLHPPFQTSSHTSLQVGPQKSAVSLCLLQRLPLHAVPAPPPQPCLHKSEPCPHAKAAGETAPSHQPPEKKEKLKTEDKVSLLSVNPVSLGLWPRSYQRLLLKIQTGGGLPVLANDTMVCGKLVPSIGLHFISSMFSQRVFSPSLTESVGVTCRHSTVVKPFPELRIHVCQPYKCPSWVVT